MQDKRIKASGESTTCCMLKSNLPKLVKLQLGKLALAIHGYSFVPHDISSIKSNIVLTEHDHKRSPGTGTIKIRG